MAKHKDLARPSESLFVLPQRHLFEKSYEEQIAEKQKHPVECLGIQFPSDEARREHFLRLLREGLEELHAKLGGVPFTTVGDAVERMRSIEKWPMGDDVRLRELAERMREAHRKEPDKDLLQRWKDEVGFPHGESEDILNLSDPPYYTACPNPFVRDFIANWSAEKRGLRTEQEGQNTQSSALSPQFYHREPFAADVSEGKNDPIYNAHSYHIKVPHKAIMRYILHYTEPGDVVFDGFCGTGMTGVAAQLCGNRSAVEGLGYNVDSEGIIKTAAGEIISRVGVRKCVLGELSTAATSIASGYNTSFARSGFAREAERILADVGTSLRQLYLTRHNSSETPGIIEYTVWSDVFICENCGETIVLWDVVIDSATRRRKSRNKVPCPHCNHIGDIRQMSRAMETYQDPGTGNIAKRVKQEPILIQYRHGGNRCEKTPDGTRSQGSLCSCDASFCPCLLSLSCR